MANLDWRTDDQADERLNPANSSRALSESEKQSSSQDAAAQAQDNRSGLAQDNIARAESQEGKNQFDYTNTRRVLEKGSSLSGRGRIKKAIPLVSLSSIVGIGAVLVGTISPATAGISFIENAYGDLNDSLTSLTISNKKLMRMKMSHLGKNNTISGCTKMSIRCKMKTLSKTEIARLERSGIKVNTTEKSFGRYKVDSIEFHGQTFDTPEKWANELRTNPRAKNAQIRANNMKYRGLLSRGPFGAVLKRFGISKKPPGLKGTKEERRNQLMTAAGVKELEDVKFIQLDDGSEVVDDGSFEKDENGNPVIKDEDGNSRPLSSSDIDTDKYAIYTKDEAAKAKKVLKNKSRLPPRHAGAMLGAASILGAADLACSIKNMIQTASVGAKIAQETQLVKYAMPLLSIIGKIKAGEASPEDAEVIGDWLTEIDNRETIIGVDDKNIVDGSEPEASSINNPNFRKSAMDSSLLSMSTNGGVNTNETTSSFMVGMGEGILFSAIGAGNLISTFDSYGADLGCKIIQHPLTRIGGIALSIIAGGATLGGWTAGQVALTAAMFAAIIALDVIINHMLSGNIVNGLESNPVGRGEALWTGIASISGASARATGLVPGGVDDLREYASIGKTVKEEYIAVEKEDARKNPFDLANQYSFTGFIARTISRNFGYSNKPINLILGVVNTSMGIMNPIKPAFAKEFNDKRFQQCDDKAYTDIGISADVQCNVRYFTPAEDLAKDPEDVLNYMINNGYISEDSETGLPDDYTPPDQASEQNALVQTVTGMTVGQFVNTNRSYLGKSGEFKKFLDGCVYRSAPFGKTGEESQLFNGIGAGYDSGEKCSSRKDEEVGYFRAYMLLLNSMNLADIDEDSDQGSSQAAQPFDGVIPDNVEMINGEETGGKGWTLKPGTDYSNVACAAGTTVVDEKLEVMVNGGSNSFIKTCSVPMGNTTAKVSSLITSQLVKMIQSAEKDGVILQVNPGGDFRTNAEQAALYASLGAGSAAPPGWGQHERGLAIDYNTNCGRIEECPPGTSPVYEWLQTKGNAAKFGFYKLWGLRESWHFSTSGY